MASMTELSPIVLTNYRASMIEAHMWTCPRYIRGQTHDHSTNYYTIKQYMATPQYLQCAYCIHSALCKCTNTSRKLTSGKTQLHCDFVMFWDMITVSSNWTKANARNKCIKPSTLNGYVTETDHGHFQMNFTKMSLRLSSVRNWQFHEHILYDTTCTIHNA